MARYASLNHVPRGFRRLKGSALTLEQVNEIVDGAEKASTGPEDFALCLGKAKAKFELGHVALDGVWVKK
jgi:hypothetical protein